MRECPTWIGGCYLQRRVSSNLISRTELVRNDEDAAQRYFVRLIGNPTRHLKHGPQHQHARSVRIIKTIEEHRMKSLIDMTPAPNLDIKSDHWASTLDPASAFIRRVTAHSFTPIEQRGREPQHTELKEESHYILCRRTSLALFVGLATCCKTDASIHLILSLLHIMVFRRA